MGCATIRPPPAGGWIGARYGVGGYEQDAGVSQGLGWVTVVRGVALVADGGGVCVQGWDLCVWHVRGVSCAQMAGTCGMPQMCAGCNVQGLQHVASLCSYFDPADAKSTDRAVGCAPQFQPVL